LLGPGVNPERSGKEKVIRKTVALTSTLVLLILVSGPISIPAQVSEAQLVGEWVGDWKAEHGVGPKPTPPRGEQNAGEYRLTILKVEDGKVHGRVRQPGSTLPEFDFVGTLNQNVLSYGNERIQTQLTIDGNRMKGTRLGGPLPWQISLQKKK
jgi:hypothetical protein